MTTVGPAPPPLPSVPGTATAAIVSDAGEAIARLASGTILEARVVGRDAAGLLHLATAHGGLSIRTSLSPPKDSIVTLEIQNLGNQISVVVLAVRRPAADAVVLPQALPRADLHPPEVAASRQPGEPAASALRAGAVVVARIVSGPAGGLAPLDVLPGDTPPTAAQATLLASGTRLTLRALAIGEPAALRPANTAAGGAPASGHPALSIAAPDGPAPAAAGTVARTPALAMSAKAPAPVAPPIAHGVRESSGRVVVDAVVAGWTPPDRLMVRMSFGTAVVQAASGPLPGTPVTFEILDLRQPPPIGHGATGAWSSLDDALRHLADVDPAIARQLADDVLPRADRNVAAAVIGYLRSLRARDLGGWLGGTAFAVVTGSGRGDLIGRLAAEFGENVRSGFEPGTDWRSVIVPFHDGDRLHAIRLSFHRRRPADDRSRAARRFLVTLQTSRLGPLQFDGLVIDRRFELIVRSRDALAAPHRSGIRAVFDDACGVTGLNGHIAFAGGPFVDPGADKSARHVAAPVVA
jgi:hypothetical protein